MKVSEENAIPTVSPIFDDAGCCSGNTGTSPLIVHLPVAPLLMARTRFSPPPPKPNQCLTIAQALELLGSHKEKHGAGVAMAAISGPGDPLATPDLTLEAVSLIRQCFPQLPVALLTCGIGSAALAGDLAAAGVSYVEMRVEAVKTDILEKLFAWVRPGSKTVRLQEGVALLLKEQREGVSALKFKNIQVNILTTLYPGYNLTHTGSISSEMEELGADSISIVAYTPEPGVEVELEIPNDEQVSAAKEKAAAHLPVVAPQLLDPAQTGKASVAGGCAHLPKPTPERPNVAVVSSTGIDVDLHLGHAVRFLVYGPRGDGLNCLLETRPAPEPGSGKQRWLDTAETLRDCFVLLAASAGQTPRNALATEGLPVLITEENIDAAVDALYTGGKKQKGRRV